MDPAIARIGGDRAMGAIMVGAVWASAAFAAVSILAHGLATGALGLMGTLFSIAAFPMTVLVFWAARRLYGKERRTRLFLLRREDIRNRDYALTTISLCRSLVLGTEGHEPSSLTVMLAVRHVADRIGITMALHGYLFTKRGRQTAFSMLTSALDAISSQACSPAEISNIVYSLDTLGSEMQGVDDDILVRRRLQEAGSVDPDSE